MITTERVSILFNGIRENWNISWCRFSYNEGKKRCPINWITRGEALEKDSFSGKTRTSIIFDTIKRKRYTEIWLDDKKAYSVKENKTHREKEKALLFLLFKKEESKHEAKIFSKYNERIAERERIFKGVHYEGVCKKSGEIDLSKVKTNHKRETRYNFKTTLSCSKNLSK